MSRSLQRVEEEVIVPPILKFDGSIKGPVAAGLLSTDS